MRKFNLAKTYQITAIIFISLSIILIILTCSGTVWCKKYIDVSLIFATLAGSILVFSTLEIQRKALKEEKAKNELSRFDSQFYPILSSFRKDAADMEIICGYISDTRNNVGNEIKRTYNGDRAFHVASSIIDKLLKSINEPSLPDYDPDQLKEFIDDIRNKMDSLDENSCSIDFELNKLEKEEKNYINTFQVPFLLQKYGISKEKIKEYSKMDRDELLSLLLVLLAEHQPTIFKKYINSLRFILDIVGELSDVGLRNKYYQHIRVVLDKEECSFLQLFKEFDKITKLSGKDNNLKPQL